MCAVVCDCQLSYVVIVVCVCVCVCGRTYFDDACVVPLCVTLISLSMLYAVHIIRVICY